MISPAATRRFLARELPDYRSWKKLTRVQLHERMLKLPERPPIWKKLSKHQRACLLIGARLGRFAFHMDTGMGKTLLSIALHRYFHKIGKVQRTLVLVPNKTNKGEWRREVIKHAPALACVVLRGTTADKWAQLADIGDAHFAVETFGGFSRMIGKMIAGKKGKNKLQIDVKLVAKLAALFQMLVIDESTFIANKKSVAHRAAVRLSKGMHGFFELTGTPFGRDPEMLWAQAHAIDGGQALGETLGLFRSGFYRENDGWFGGKKYVFIKSMKRELNRRLAAWSLRYTAAEGDMPPVVEIPKYITLPKSAEDIYEAARNAVNSKSGSWQEKQAGFIRMRQISSGWVGYYDDELGTKASYEITPNPKLELLCSLVQEIAPNHKLIVFHEFTFTGDMLVREMKRLKIKHGRIYGKSKDPEGVRDAFEDDPNMKVLLLQNAAGGFGLNLQFCQYSIYYESPVSPIIRKQTERRTERQFSKYDRVFRYDLLTKGCVDDRIRQFHKEGRDLLKAVVDGDTL